MSGAGAAKSNNKATKKANNTPKGSGTSLKEREQKRKQVFKPILDNAFTQTNWPFIEPSLGNSILESLEILLSPIGRFNSKSSDLRIDEPIVSQHVRVGFNPVTKALENQAQKIKSSPVIKYVFVCKADIPNSMVVQHFPVLTYTASKGIGEHIKLIQVPRGSSERLSRALGTTDETVVGISGDISGYEGLFDLFNKVPDVTVPFLEEIYEKEGHFKPAVIKFLNTTAPAGPSLKKAQKKERKKIVKQRKAEKAMQLKKDRNKS